MFGVAFRVIAWILLVLVATLSLVGEASEEKDASSSCSVNDGPECGSKTAFASDSAKEKPVCPVVKKRLLNGQVLVGYVRGSRAVGGRCLPPSAQDLHAAIEGPRGKAEKAAMPTCPVVKKTLAGTGEQHHGFAVDLTRGECRPPGWRSVNQMQLPPCPDFRTELPNGQKLYGYVVNFHDGKQGKSTGGESCRIEPTTTYADKQREQAQKENEAAKKKKKKVKGKQ